MINNENKNYPVVTIIIPCYNAGKTLAQAVESVLSQSYSNIECLIIDDGSDDPLTLIELDTARMRGIFVIKTVNRGLPAARNIGVAKASGSFIVPLDADDWLADKGVELMVKTFFDVRNQEPSKIVAFVFGNMMLHGARSGPKECFANPFELLFFNTLSYCLMWDREILLKLGLYDQDMSLGYEDWELAIRATSRGYSAEKVANSVLNYRVQPNGMLLSKSKPNHEVIFEKIRKLHINAYSGEKKITLTQVLGHKSRLLAPVLLSLYVIYKVPLGERIISWVFKKRFSWL